MKALWAILAVLWAQVAAYRTISLRIRVKDEGERALRAMFLNGVKRPSSGAAAAGKGFVEREVNPSKTKSKRDIEIEAKNAEMLSKLGLDALEDDVQTGADLRKHRKDASKLKRKKDAKKAKLAEKKRSKGCMDMDADGSILPAYGEDEVETSSAVWEILCGRTPYLLPEHMDNLLIIEDSEEDGDIDEEDLRQEMSQVVEGAITESDGFLKVLRTFAMAGKGELFNGEYGNSDSYFLFMLAAYVVLIDSHLGSSSGTSTVDALEIFDYYFRTGAWAGLGAEEALSRFNLLDRVLKTWDFTEETSESSATGMDITGSGGGGMARLSSRCVVVAPQQGTSSSGEKNTAISMHDAATVGLLCTALEAVGAAGGDTRACCESIGAELRRQGDLFTKMNAAAKRRADSSPTIIAFIKAAVILIASARGVEGLEEEVESWAEGWGAQVEQAHELCEAAGISTTPPPMVTPYKSNQDSARGSLAVLLRDCPGLKRSADFRLPVTPFFDSFARSTRTHPALSDEDGVQIASALINALAATGGDDGLDRLGACRFLAGINAAGKSMEQLMSSSKGKGFDKRTKQAWNKLTEEEVGGGMLTRALEMSQQEFIQQVVLRVAE